MTTSSSETIPSDSRIEADRQSTMNWNDAMPERLPTRTTARTSWTVAVAAALGWALVASITLGPQVALTLAGLGAIVALVFSLVVAEELAASGRLVRLGEPDGHERGPIEIGPREQPLGPLDRMRLRCWLASTVASRRAAMDAPRLTEEASVHLGKRVDIDEVLDALVTMRTQAAPQWSPRNPGIVA